MREEQLLQGQYYHLYNRGVERRRIFLDQNDYQRFCDSMVLFNDENFLHLRGDDHVRMSRLARIEAGFDSRELLVGMISFCLMPNHFHFLVEQRAEKGISRFMHRLEMGYAKYFNLRNKHDGRLFESTFKAVPVESDSQLCHLPRYIHLNALDLMDSRWRDGRIHNWPCAEEFLCNYRWSSHAIFLGTETKSSMVDIQSVRRLFPSREEYVEYLKGWSGRFTLPPGHSDLE